MQFDAVSGSVLQISSSPPSIYQNYPNRSTKYPCPFVTSGIEHKKAEIFARLRGMSRELRLIRCDGIFLRQLFSLSARKNAMIVMKFGGTSVQDATAINQVVEIVSARLADQPVVVVSAMTGVTDALLRIARMAEERR